MFASYGVVLRSPRAARVFGAALLGRLSYGTVGLSLTLTFVQTTGSYARAGAMVALFGGTSSLLTPWRASLVDRFGPRAALRPMAVLYGLGLVGLAVAAHMGSVPLSGVVAVLAGACTPPLGPVMRALWPELVPDRSLLQSAYSLDTVCEQIIFTVGPLLAGLFAVLSSATVGLLVSAGLVIVGTFGLTTVRNTITRPAEAVSPEGSESAAGRPEAPVPGAWSVFGRLWPTLLAMAALGAAESGLALLNVAFAGAAGAAWAEAAMSVAGVAGGLVYGVVTWRMAPGTRLPLLSVPIALTLAAAGLAPGVPALIAIVAVFGLFIAPTLTTGYLVVENAAPPQRRTAVASWVNTAFNAGASLGAAGVGALTDLVSLPLCFVFAAVPVLVASGVGLAGTRRSAAVGVSDQESASAAEEALAV
ncbi:MFS transporter [Actinomadura oligospora]|uniref:MFS transporter n=1 Tax=Actinomadura oligospora TaxID=111804 RepID=UPI0004B62DED|nr:MFS transporter [Actinomadura oligospora]